MKVRALIRLLLILALGATHASAGARFAEREPRAARQQLTAEEAREARDVAAALFDRLSEEPDFAPLVGEMFAPDFAERLHASASTAGSLYFLDRLAAAEATRDEVLRHHVAFNNLFLLTTLYLTDARLAARAARQAVKNGDETNQETDAEEFDEDEKDYVNPADVLPPDVVEVFKSDPRLAHAVGEGEAGEAARQEDEEMFIETAEQLRTFTATVERANELLRKRLTPEQKKRVFGYWRAVAESEDSDLMRPYAAVAPKEWYGYPEGTRLLCFGLLVFQVELVRVGAGYKVLSVSARD